MSVAVGFVTFIMLFSSGFCFYITPIENFKIASSHNVVGVLDEMFTIGPLLFVCLFRRDIHVTILNCLCAFSMRSQAVSCF